MNPFCWRQLQLGFRRCGMRAPRGVRWNCVVRERRIHLPVHMTLPVSRNVYLLCRVNAYSATYIYTYVYIYAYASICVYVHVYIYICVRICICMYALLVLKMHPISSGTVRLNCGLPLRRTLRLQGSTRGVGQVGQGAACRVCLPALGRCLKRFFLSTHWYKLPT